MAPKDRTKRVFALRHDPNPGLEMSRYSTNLTHPIKWVVAFQISPQWLSRIFLSYFQALLVYFDCNSPHLVPIISLFFAYVLYIGLAKPPGRSTKVVLILETNVLQVFSLRGHICTCSDVTQSALYVVISRAMYCACLVLENVCTSVLPLHNPQEQ